MTVIYNARLVMPNSVIADGWIQFARGKIERLGDGDIPSSLPVDEALDAKGQWLVPGFIDMHVHGAAGADVMDGKVSSIHQIGRFLLGTGTTGWLPTTVTAKFDQIKESIISVKEAKSEAIGSSILGVHLEGPMISAKKLGAQNPQYVVAPDIRQVESIVNEAPGLIRKVTLAPEEKGALSLIEWLKNHEIIASIGHTDATFFETMLGIQAGCTHATHLFNAMRGIHHREPGALGACLSSNEIIAELIVDGIHVDYNAIRLALPLKDIKRIVLITDAIAAAGMADGSYDLGGMTVKVSKGTCVVQGTDTLAGSTLTMNQAVKNVVNELGLGMQDAVQMASTNPARELGLSASKGTIAPGYDADLVLLKENFDVSETYIGGIRVFKA